MRHIDSLTKRLTHYTAITAAAIGANSVGSKAQIIYYDPEPDISYNDSAISLDLNNDGIFDFKFKETHYFYDVGCWWSGETYDVANPLATHSLARENNYAAALNAGEAINESLDWTSLKQNLLKSGFVSSSCYSAGSSSFFYSGPWGDGEDYLGIKLHLTDGIHYGWIRINVYQNLIKDYAYQAQPDVSIMAGESPYTGVPFANINGEAIVTREGRKLIVSIDPELEAGEFRLIDALGNTRILSILNSSRSQFNVDEFPSGIYFAIVRNGEKEMVKKIFLR